MFEGTPQGLDHHVVNNAALARNTRIAIARVNSDFPEDPAATYASNVATPERNSDHDPVVSYYSLNQQQVAGSIIISEFRFRGPGSGAPPETATLSLKGCERRLNSLACYLRRMSSLRFTTTRAQTSRCQPLTVRPVGPW